MIEIVIGQVGAGKSYYAAYRIIEEIKKIYAAQTEGENYKYNVIYTNLEGVQENKYVKKWNAEEWKKIWAWELEQYKNYIAATAEHINLPKINFKNADEKKEVLNILEEIKTTKFTTETNLIQFNSKLEKILNYINISDKKIEEYTKHTKPYFIKNFFENALFILDEAHNQFKYADAVKMRAISFHRHYNQDYILITQDLKQLDIRIRNIALKTIKAVSPGLRIGNNFAYKVYAGGYISFRNTNMLQSIKLKKDPYVFNFYQTGGYLKADNSLKHIFKRMFLPYLILLAVGAAYFFYKQHKETTQITAINTKHKIVKAHKKNKIIKELIIKQIGNSYKLNNKYLTYAQFKRLVNNLKPIKIIYNAPNAADIRRIELIF